MELYYGSRVRYKKATARFFLCSAIAFVGLVLLYPFYKQSSARAVRAAFGTMPDVQGVQLYGVDADPFPWTPISVTVLLKGGPSRRVVFYHPMVKEMRNGTHTYLAAIGPYRLYAILPDGSHEAYVDVGTQGAFRGLFSIPNLTASEVIRNYDQLVVEMARMPSSGTAVDTSGTSYEYHIVIDK